MLLSGIQKFSLLDFPQKTSCIIFTAGCNFRCGYCHNPEFVLPEEILKIKDSFIPERVFFNFLEKRKGMLDGVVITGGEPTLQLKLSDFIKKIKEKGFLVKLDTNGSKPEVLEQLLAHNLLDYVAMDVKTSLANYQNLVGASIDSEKILSSINLLKAQKKIDYEFRTTMVREYHSEEVIKNMAQMLLGAKKWYWQLLRVDKNLDSSFGLKYQSYNSRDLEMLKYQCANYVDILSIR